MFDLILKDIGDVYSRENFFRISNFFKSIIFSNSTFKVFNIDIKNANASFSVKHGFTFIPQDIIVTRIEGDFNFFFRYQEFDRENIYITADGPVRIKFLAGSFDTKIQTAFGETYTLVPPA